MNKRQLSKSEVARKYWRRFQVEMKETAKPGEPGAQWVFDGNAFSDQAMLQDIGTAKARLLARFQRYCWYSPRCSKWFIDCGLGYHVARLSRQYIARWWTDNVRPAWFPGSYGLFEFYCIEELDMPGKMHWD